MNTETSRLKYQLISWITMLDDTNLLMELSKILQKDQNQQYKAFELGIAVAKDKYPTSGNPLWA